jgi:hypothetical protein
MSRKSNAVECQGCKAIWSVNEGLLYNHIPSHVVEKLVLLRCPLCCEIAFKKEEKEIESKKE